MRPHPSDLSLSRHLDGDLPPAKTEAVAAHLEACDRCRERVEFYRELGEAARRSPTVEPPDVTEAVLARRRAGERIDLSAPPRRAILGPRRGWAIAASVAVAALAAGYLLMAPTASAHRSTLRFLPEAPRAGDTIQVVYTPVEYLAGEDSLRLRIRARAEDTPFPGRGPIGELRTATLRRTAAGTFEGSVSLESDELYLAAAVEDFEAGRVDANLGRLWDVVVVGDDGRPSTDALESQGRVREPYSWSVGSGWAEEIAERWPGEPFAWTQLYVDHTRLSSIELPDSLRRFHRQRLEEMAERADELKPDQLAWLSTYARLQGRTALQDSLVDRLARLDPLHRTVSRSRLLDVLAETGGDPDARLAGLETLWRDIAGRPRHDVVHFGLEAAAAAGDTAAGERWIERGRRAKVSVELLANLLDGYAGFAGVRARLRRAALEEAGGAGDDARPLRLTAAQHDAERAARIRALQTRLAVDLAETADTAAALDLLAEVAGHAWRPELLRPYVDLLLATGDTASARPVVELLYVDPFSGEEARKRYAAVVPPESGVTDAEAEYARRVRATIEPGRRLPASTELRLADGRTRAARSLAGSPTVIFRREAGGRAEAPVLAEFAALASHPSIRDRVGALLLTNTSDAPGEAMAALDVVADPEREIQLTLDLTGASEFAVLDSDLTVVARVWDDPATAFRIALALAADTTDTD